MKRNTIKWRIFKYNIIIIVLLIALVTIIFNVAVNFYIKNDILGQLEKIAKRTENTALQRGPDFFPEHGEMKPPPDLQDDNDVFRYYFMLDRSLREPLSVLNADYILLDSNKNVINPSPEEFYNTSSALITQVISQINTSGSEIHTNFSVEGTKYIAIIKPVSSKNTFGLGWIVIYSSIQKVNQLQLVINIILFTILMFSAIIILIFSSLISKKISAPISSLNNHIRDIAERNFSSKIDMTVDDELLDFVNNINIMTDKLETYDQAQKTFLQNASHEFRTPLMSIQSYAEGIKYGVVDDNNSAVDIILSETKRISNLVEELLYLSRLDTIEENFRFEKFKLYDLINSCTDRLKVIAANNNINFDLRLTDTKLKIYGDEEKLSRAITNIISNCLRYAKTKVIIEESITEDKMLELIISDDGQGFDEEDLKNLFERFYKGKKGNFGLGLAITKNIIEKHNGRITAENTDTGAMYKIMLPLK